MEIGLEMLEEFLDEINDDIGLTVSRDMDRYFLGLLDIKLTLVESFY